MTNKFLLNHRVLWLLIPLLTLFNFSAWADGTLTVDYDSFSSHGTSYSDKSWSATTSTSNSISGSATVCFDDGENYVKIKNGHPAFRNSTALPGAIKSIYAIRQSDGSNRTLNIYAGTEALTNSNYTTKGTSIGTLTVTTSGATKAFTAAQISAGYTYFYIYGSSNVLYLDEIVITFETGYTITFKETGGSNNGSGSAAANATSMTIGTAPTPATGKMVEGYYAENTLTTKIANSDGSWAANNIAGWVTSGKYTKGSAANLYIKWTDLVTTVTLDKGTDGTTDGTATITYNATSFTTKTDATKTGYHLSGYYTTAGGGSKVIDADGSLVSSLSGWTSSGKWIKNATEATLYAHWTIDDYTVSWSVNGESWTTGVSSSNNHANYNNKITAMPTDPTSSNCDNSKVFVGWTKSSSYSSATTPPSDLFTTVAGSPTITGNTTFYAVFATADANVTAKDTWKKISSTSQITDGMQVLLVNKNSTTYYAINSSAGATSVTGVGSSTFTNNNNALRFAVEKGVSNYKFKTLDGKYLSTTAQSNNTTLQLDKTYDAWTISSDAGSETGTFNLVNSIALEYYSSTLKLYGWSDGYKQYYRFVICIPAYTNYATSCCTQLGSINGSVNVSQGGNSVTISGWSDVANVGTYTVRMYKKNGASWDLVSGTTSGGSAGTQGTRTGITGASKSVTYTGLEVESEYKFTVQAIAGSASYCDGDETAVTTINSTDVSSTPFKFRYAIYIDDGTNDNYTYHYITPTANANEGSVTIDLNAHVDYYQFKIAGGFSGWWGQTGTDKIPANTKWTLDGSNNVRLNTGAGGTYTFTVDYSGTTNPGVTVTFPSADQVAGYKIYFDKSIIDGWGNTLKYRIGNNTHNQNQDFTLVTGTDNFYVTTTPSYGSMDAWQIANNVAWSGSNSIYNYHHDDANDITKATVYFDYVVEGDITMVPSSKKNTESGCDFWYTSKTDGMLTHNVAVGTAAHGTVVATYTNTSGTIGQTVAEGANADLAHRCIVTITATPDAGYTCSSLTVNGAAFTSGNTHILTADATIAATFTAQTSTVTLDNNSATSGGQQTVTATYDAAMPLTTTSSVAVAALSRTGYTFTGWWDATSGGTQYYSYSGSPAAIASAHVWDKTGAQTLKAQWTPINYTISYDLDGGSVETPNPTSYTIESTAITLNNPTKTGYDFAGWTGTGLAEATMSVTIAAGSTGERSYTATWSIKKYTVTWHVGDATSTTSNVNHGTTFSTLEASAPAHADNALAACGSTKFIGWVKAAGAYDEDGKTVTWYNTYKYSASDEITSDSHIYAMYAEAGDPASDWTKYEESTLAEGDYLLIQSYSTYKVILKADVDATPRFTKTTATITAGVVTSPDTKTEYIWRLSKSGNYYKFYNPNSGKYIVSTGTKSQADLVTTPTADKDLFSVTYNTTDHYITITNKYNSTNSVNADFKYGGDYWACYSGTANIDLYWRAITYTNYRTGCTVSCSRPTPVAPASITKTGATISWTDPATSGTLDHYEYKVWEDGDDEPVSGTTNGTNLSKALTGLYSGVTYHWKVRRVCTGEDASIWASGSDFTTTDAAITFSVPTGVSAIDASTTASNLPEAGVATDCGDCWAFAGWTTASYDASTSAPATLFASGTKAKVSGDATLYAVYQKSAYRIIKQLSDFTADEQYIITFDSVGISPAMTSSVVSTYYTSSTDVYIKTDSKGAVIENPAAGVLWTFTGTTSAGTFQNVSSNKYLDLSDYDAPPVANSTSDNVNITVFSAAKKQFDIESNTTDGNYLVLYKAGWGVDNDHTGYFSCNIFKRAESTYSTSPSCSKYTVTFSKNGSTHDTKYVTACDGYLSATPSDPNDNTLDVNQGGCITNGKGTFMGWSPTRVVPAQDEEPDELYYDLEDFPEIKQNTTFYAVFAEENTGSIAATNKTYTFTSKAWADSESAWTSGSDGNALTSGRGVQITKGVSGANATTTSSYDDVTKVTVTYSTNASDGAGTIDIKVNGTSYTGSASVSTSGGTSDRTIDFTPPGSALDGAVKITVTCTTNSIYIKSVQIFYTGSTTTYEGYRTACCDDADFKFVDETPAEITEYTIVREDLSSSSDYGTWTYVTSSSNTTGTISWASTARQKSDNNTAFTWSPGGTNQSSTGEFYVDVAKTEIKGKKSGVYVVTLSQASGETTYCDENASITITVKTVDKFIDAVNGNFSGEAQRLEDTGNGITLPTEATFSTNNGCESTARRLIGWIRASDLATYASGGRVDKIDDLKTADASNKVIAPGTKQPAEGTTWYAVWGVEK